jgi:uncharacterized protein YuzE
MNNNKPQKAPMLHYDADEDILALYWKRGTEESFEELAPGVFIEFDKDGNLIGLEIFNASKTLRSAIKPLARRALLPVR